MPPQRFIGRVDKAEKKIWLGLLYVQLNYVGFELAKKRQ